MTTKPIWVTDYYGEIAGKHVAIEWDIATSESPILIVDGKRMLKQPAAARYVECSS